MSTSGTLTSLVSERTKSAHQHAESKPFITGLLAGSASVRCYVSLIGALLPVYQTLESQMRRHNDDASIAMFDHRRLDRSARICADLRGFGQDPNGIVVHPATRRYVESIEDAAASPQRLLAHHYTRYLGDLAGGQAIARCVMTYYDVDPGKLSFYDFSDLGDVVHYRRRYKSLLDLVPWSAGEKEQFIVEAEKAFELNAALFDELDGTRRPTDACANLRGLFQAERAHSPR
jgi:heme oxygenase